MPQLIFLSQFFLKDGNLDSCFYFKDSCGYGRNSKFDIKVTYPFEIYMHEDTYGKEINNEILIELRRFVERRANGDVILSHNDLSHVWCWNADTAKGEWDRSYSDIRHRYIVLNFECEEDLITWKLMYPDYVTDQMSEWHPEYAHLKECKKHRYG